MPFYHSGPFRGLLWSVVVAAFVGFDVESARLVAEDAPSGDADDQPVVAKKPTDKNSTIKLVSNEVAADETAAEKKQVLLRYRFRPNQFLHYKVVHEMVIQMEAKGLTEVTKNTSISKQHLRVVSVGEDGSAIMEAMLDHVNMKSKFDDNEPTEFDTADPDKRPTQFEHILKEVGKPQGRVRVDATGKVLEMNVTAGKNATAKNSVIKNISKTESDKPEQEKLESYSLLVPLPEKPVALGEKWIDYMEIKVQVNKLTRTIKVRRAYTLTKIEGNIAKIEFKTSILDDPQDPEVRVQLIQRTPSGSIRFDIENGKIISNTMHSDQTEIGIAGADSRMRAVSNRTESLFTPD
ncbi:MAG: DUF6263 family protein [Planctomycetaceae bacterium]